MPGIMALRKRAADDMVFSKLNIKIFKKSNLQYFIIVFFFSFSFIII